MKKNKYIKIGLIVVCFSICCVLNYFSHNLKMDISNRKDQLECEKLKESKEVVNKGSYNEILKFVNGINGLEIRNIIKEGDINKFVNLELEYIGNINDFDNKLSTLSKKENFYNIDRIKITKMLKNNVEGKVFCKFKI